MITNDQTIEILDHLVAALGKQLGTMNDRIRQLESDGELTILDEIDWENPPPHGTSLARHKNGLWSYSRDTGAWRCVANSINSIEAIPTPTGAKFFFERSTGDIFEAGEITLPKPVRRKAVKNIAA